jgi:hypothetical protein
LHRPHSLFRQFQVAVRRRWRRFEESVESDDRFVMDAKQQSGFLPSLQRHPQFVQAVAHRPTKRHSERPAELNRVHREAHFPSVLFIELLEPLQHRLIAAPEDTDRNDGIAGMLKAGMSWSSIQAATGCSRATVAKVAKRAA